MTFKMCTTNSVTLVPIFRQLHQLNVRNSVKRGIQQALCESLKLFIYPRRPEIMITQLCASHIALLTPTLQQALFQINSGFTAVLKQNF